MNKKMLLLAAAQALILTGPPATHAHALGDHIEVAPGQGAAVVVAPSFAVNNVDAPASNPHIQTAANKPPLGVDPPNLRRPVPGFLPVAPQ
jgi:hypothetical protein